MLVFRHFPSSTLSHVFQLNMNERRREKLAIDHWLFFFSDGGRRTIGNKLSIPPRWDQTLVIQWITHVLQVNCLIAINHWLAIERSMFNERESDEDGLEALDNIHSFILASGDEEMSKEEGVNGLKSSAGHIEWLSVYRMNKTMRMLNTWSIKLKWIRKKINFPFVLLGHADDERRKRDGRTESEQRVPAALIKRRRWIKLSPSSTMNK